MVLPLLLLKMNFSFLADLKAEQELSTTIFGPLIFPRKNGR
jgi:hypothetical protein